MTTKKDLVEAHQFSRRRLVTAFLSGAPGGREVEPARPGRTIVGGIAVAVLLIAGGAIASVLKPKAPEGWESQGLVVTDRGARYVVTQDKQPLRPVVNLTSAQLILGLETPAQVVSQKTVDKSATPGSPIGIEGAPEELPTTDHFIESGWTACTVDGAGVAVDISRSPQIETSGADPNDMGFLVQADAKVWLIAETLNSDGDPVAYRYAMPSRPDAERAMASGIFDPVPPTTVAKVPESWVELFQEGTPLGLAGLPKGDVYKNGDGKYFLAGKAGSVPLTDFAAQVYLASTGKQPLAGTPPQTSQGEAPKTNWPSAQLKPPTKPQLCAQLVADPGKAAIVRIGTSTGNEAWPEDPADQPAPSTPVENVDSGMGAFVYASGAGSDKGTDAFMVDARGGAYRLEAGLTIPTLGLDTYKAPVIPGAWIDVLGPGTPLSTERALCPPATEPEGKSGKCAPAASGS